jgi:hypothetical protein
MKVRLGRVAAGKDVSGSSWKRLGQLAAGKVLLGQVNS